jgi:RNA polymerase subunit RPABC4/transcription elongation factor Spt4
MNPNLFQGDRMNWNNVSLVVLGLAAFFGAFLVALWASLVIWTFRDMRARTRDAFAQILASVMVLVLGPFGVVLYFILRPSETLAEKYERSLEEEALLQDIEERHICPGCKQPIESDFVLCPICHTHLRHPCIHCGRLIHPRWSLCPYCGQDQKPIPGLDRAGVVTLEDLGTEVELPAESLAYDAGAPPAFEMQPQAAAPGEMPTEETNLEQIQLEGAELEGIQLEDTDPEELPQELLDELQKEADASMAAPASEPESDQPPAPGDATAPTKNLRLRLPFGRSSEESAENAAQESESDQTDPDTETGTREPLSLFRRR